MANGTRLAVHRTASEALTRVHGTIAIVLGVWEAFAFMTHTIPTVSQSYARWKQRHRLAATVSLLVWLSSLGRHLYTEEVHERKK